MHYVKQFDINGVATKQVACIELHGKPNAATEGYVGVLGIDMDSPTHEVYKCCAVNGSIYTWELLSSGMSIMSATISGGGVASVQFPYANIRIPTTYVVKVGDLILDKDGYLYQISALNSTYCVASYCTRVVAYGMSAYDLAVKNGYEGSEEEWLLSLQGKGLDLKASKSSCTELGDGYIDSNGDLQILTTLPSTFTNCGQIRGPQGESLTVSWSIAYYGVSNSASTRPTSWSSSIPTNITEGQFLWTRTDIRFSDGSTASGYTYSKQGAKGDKGDKGTSLTVTNVSESTESGGSNVVTFSDGKTLTVKNGKDGVDGKSAYQYAQEGGYSGTEAEFSAILANAVDKRKITLGLHVDGLIYIFIDDEPVGNGIALPSGSNYDVYGNVDSNKHIVLQGNLSEDDTYTFAYIMKDGSTVPIGAAELDTKVYYAITKNLTNCTINNSATSIVEGESYSATISANDGYELSSVVVTMGGSAVSVTNGVINIANVTGNIVITAVAEEVAAGPTNFIEYNADNTEDWSIWCNNARIGSDGLHRPSTASNVTNYIPVQNGDIVYWHDMPIYGAIIGLYKSDKTNLGSAVIDTQVTNGYIKDNTSVNANTYEGQLTINNASVAYIRFTIKRDGYTSVFDNDDGIVNIQRNGEWL